jgi:ABC-type sugar transport system permease subunit
LDEEPTPRERTAIEHAEAISHLFKVLWPVVLAVVGLVLLISFLFVHSLHDPTFVAAIGSFYGLIGFGGTALTRSKA